MIRAAALLLAAIALPAWSVQPPPRVELTFSVSAASMDIGEGRDVLEHDGKAYKVTSSLKIGGSYDDALSK